MEEESKYGLRKRRRVAQGSAKDDSLERLLQAAETSSKILVFSGSGLSATSGMSTFSTPGGLYDRAQRKFKVADGKNLFTYSFYDKNKADARAFFAEIYLEALRARPALGHMALAELFNAGRLQRHYTLNIDGLAEKVGMDIWHPEDNPNGITVEMHGNIHYLVCPECHATQPMQTTTARALRDGRELSCSQCSHSPLRFKVMLYEDAEGECITPEEVMDLMEEDVVAADLILWVGISFQQSASTAYFRKARGWLQKAGRLDGVLQVVVNPSDEALWNLMTASSNQHELSVLEVLMSSDKLLPLLASKVLSSPIAPLEKTTVAVKDNEAPAAAALDNNNTGNNGLIEQLEIKPAPHQQQQQENGVTSHPIDATEESGMVELANEENKDGAKATQEIIEDALRLDSALNAFENLVTRGSAVDISTLAEESGQQKQEEQEAVQIVPVELHVNIEGILGGDGTDKVQSEQEDTAAVEIGSKIENQGVIE